MTDSKHNPSEQPQAHLIRHLNVMERIGQISTATDNIEEMLSGVLGEILDIFDADRAWLLHPCDPDAPFWYVPMERTRPAWPGAFASSQEIPMTPEVSGIFREMLTAHGAVQYGPQESKPVPAEIARAFSVQSQLQILLRPKVGGPWLLGLHHCARMQIHGHDDLLLFNAVAQRISDSLSSLISLKNLRESERKFRHMLETSPIAVRIATCDGRRVVFANDRYAQLIGVSRDQVIGTDPNRNYANPQDYEDILRQLAQGKSVTNKLVQHNIGERVSWVLASLLNIEYENEPAVLGWFYDVTELKNANEDQQLATLVYQNSSQAMMVTDAAGIIITINPAFTETTGYTLDEVAGKSTRILSSGRQDQRFFRDMWDTLTSTGHWEGEIWNRRKNGELYAEWLTINTIFSENGAVHRRVALFSDITQKKQAEELIWQQANFDPLTQLPNRRMFHDRLEQELKKAHRTGASIALMFIDLDHFKEVNDTLGHSMGDTLLLEVAMRIMACVRETDTVARLGGDEFTVILGELADSTSLERITQNILRNLSEPFQLGNEKAFISASIGITLYPFDATTKDALLKNADQAMYAAKALGRNQHCYFTPSMQENSLHRMRLANDLRIALAEKQFWLAYQPIVDLKTGAIHKAEALIRWQHPQFGLISPADFIPLAEEIKLINPIGDWVCREAIKQAAHWRAAYHPDFEVSINKSPVQFQRDSHTAWLECLHEHAMPGQGVVIEITEGLMLDLTQAVSDKLLEYRDMGVQVAIDDFGTGYSSLSYLKKFDIDYLKIDQSFVRNLASDSNDLVLCEAIIVMAHKLGIKVIAEGVETAQQRDLLTAAGCDYGQGYLFSRPVPAPDFEKLL